MTKQKGREVIEGLYQALQEAEIRFQQNPEGQLNLRDYPYRPDEPAFVQLDGQKLCEPYQAQDALLKLHEPQQLKRKGGLQELPMKTYFRARLLLLDFLAFFIPVKVDVAEPNAELTRAREAAEQNHDASGRRVE